MGDGRVRRRPIGWRAAARLSKVWRLVARVMNGWRALSSKWLVASLIIGLAACRERPTAGDETVVAIVDGNKITQRELDQALRPQLDELERSRYELRLAQLQAMIATRVLGEQPADADPDAAFRAARARADVQILLAPPAISLADRPAPAAEESDGGAAAGSAAPRRSTLPLTLVGTVVREDPEKSMAALRIAGAVLARNVYPGQQLVEGAVLLRVERNRIILRHQGAVEFVPLSVGSAPSTPTPARHPARFARTPDTVTSLRRNDVERALRDVALLESSLTRAAPELDGRRLLVLDGVEPGSLFDVLQLEERDVLMQVNGEWVDDSRNPLWDALRAGGTVTLMVMRAGQPRAFAYEIY